MKGDGAVDVEASDDKGVVKVEFSIDNKLVTADTPYPDKYTWASDDVSEATWSLKAVAHDTAGQTAQARIAITVDRTAPSVALTAPQDGALLSGPFLLAATASDTGLDVVSLQIDGLDPVALLEPPFETTVDPTLLASGPLTLHAVAEDKAGNHASDTRQVLPDRPPTVSLTAPSDDATLSGTTTLAAEASDDLGLDQVQWTVDGDDLTGALLFGDTWADPTATLDTTALPYGEHTIAVTVTDDAGQTAADEVQILVDQRLTVSLTLCQAGSGCVLRSRRRRLPTELRGRSCPGDGGSHLRRGPRGDWRERPGADPRRHHDRHQRRPEGHRLHDLPRPDAAPGALREVRAHLQGPTSWGGSRRGSQARWSR